jgi:hypothetical protein
MRRRKKDQRRCPVLTVRFHPDAKRWVPPRAALDKLACSLSRDLEVEYWPRRLVGRVWERDHGGEMLPVHRYAFRAYSRGNRAVLFVDETETMPSATWLLLHELAHLDLTAAPLVQQAYRSIPKPPGYLTTDAGHEAHPEEQLANAVANQILPTLGLPAHRYDRLWWRSRVRAYQGR